MAILLNKETGENVELLQTHLFGCNANLSNAFLYEDTTCPSHALLHWNGKNWSVIDLSECGTYLDGKRIPKGNCIALRSGQQLQFGSTDNHVWHVTDLSGPKAKNLTPVSLIDSDVKEQIIETRNDTLTSQNAALQTELKLILKTITETGSVKNNIVLNIEGEKFNIQIDKIAEKNNGTIKSPVPEKLHMSFFISTDEEHTKVKLYYAGKLYQLGEYVHHYLLVTLARKRLTDVSAKIDSTAQGWLEVEQLAKMLGVNIQHVNIYIFRARQQISRLLYKNKSVEIIERRRGSIRLAPFSFDIYRGERMEGKYSPLFPPE
ncbi:FHA domain-containing protein [Methylomonas rhizoryzae]|uniref:FHA domain-containing protein n=1 Tax=Methylomonas rhizoryzae TaxID=2608981 RepID=UPI0012328CFE|nr:FHA domain-containing protein [Methylomonas rhizoryzae]